MSIKVFENVDYINEINNVNLNQRLIKYSLFMKFIINNSKEVKILNLAKSIYEKSREVPSGALTAIFADPSFGFWLYISKCIENRLINNEKVPISDLPHMHFLNGGDDFLYYHLIDLNRWILGACMLSKLNFESLILMFPYKVAERLFSFGLLSEFNVGKRLPFITVPIGTTCECAYIEKNKNRNVSLYIIKSFVSMIHNNLFHHKL